MSMDRRGFIKGAAVSAAIMAGASMAACSASEATPSASAQEEPTWDYETDVAIVGSGMGGFASAFSAIENGASAIVVEISKQTGGGSAFSGGMVHMTAAGGSKEMFDTWTDRLAQDDLSLAYFEGYQELADWLDGLGLDTTKVEGFTNIKGFDYGNIVYLGSGDTKGMTGGRPFFDSCEKRLEELGGTLLLETVAQRILTDDSGRIAGLLCRDNNTREEVRIKAKAVILATGGWQANSEMRTKYWGPDASLATIMAVPYATGSGLSMAQEMGASLQGSFDTFSGLWSPAYPAKNLMEDPVVYEQMEAFDDNGKYWLYDQKLDTLPGAAIVVNLQGKRFADEGEKSHRVHQAAMKQRRATVVMICDDEAFRPWWENVEYSHRTVQQKFEDVILSDKVGGVLYEADTIEELADMLAQDGPHKVAKYNLLRTIEEYNKAAEEGTTAQLDTPRELGKISPLVTPPFHAFPMTISVYAPFGGIAIDTNAQVLDKNRQPIPGLYATSPAAGGIMREVYIGAIASAAVTGRWAGAAAAAEIKA